MRSSKGTAQFLLAALFILALLVYFSAKDADREQSGPRQQAFKAAMRPVPSY